MNELPDVDPDRGEVHRSVEALYDAHIDEVYRHIYRRCRDHGLAEDLTQETFVAAIRSRKPEEVSIAWLKRVATNRLLDVIRRQTTYASKLRLVPTGQPRQADAGVAERLDLAVALDELTVDHRLVLTLHYIDGLSVPEMAEELGRSPKSVEGLITRARRQLHHELKGNQ